MIRHRYSQWDGTQEPLELSAEDLMGEISEDLITHGDLWRALQRILQRGMRGPQGQRLEGMQELMRRLRQRRQQTLQQHNLDALLDEIKERLEHIVQKEREGIQQRLEKARQPLQPSAEGAQPRDGAEKTPPAEGTPPDERLLQMMEEMAAKKLAQLDQLPEDTGAKIKSLYDYEFMDPEAREEFQELLKMLQQQFLQNHFQSMQQQLQGLTPEDLQGLKEMLQDLNQMLRQRALGGQPDFQEFMEKYGAMFGPNPPQSLEELLQQLQERAAQMQSLLNSLSAEQRQELSNFMDALLQDEGLRQEMAELAANLAELMPANWRNQRYPFQGEDSVSLEEAMRLMEQLQGLDQLEQQLRAAEKGTALEDIDPERVRELLGNEAAQIAEQLRQVIELLEEAGFIRKGENRFELTPRGIRQIGQKALRDIFALIKRDRMGGHETSKRGWVGEIEPETKIYEFGDPFVLHLERTIMNAIFRNGGEVPVHLEEKDFEVFRQDYHSQAATVLMLDLSLSMPMRGNFYGAKKVALALDNLIRSQFPKDNLYVIGFADYARIIKRDSLHQVTWNEYVMGTNMHHALILARQLLGSHKSGTRQIIMITDGEPTAHLENGRAFFAYPPVPKTYQETLKEVKRCTQEGIIINVFMLDRRPYLKEFVNQITRINKGRAFFTTPDKLGEYILVDYVAQKSKRIA